jgi:hypothetical protein
MTLVSDGHEAAATVPGDCQQVALLEDVERWLPQEADGSVSPPKP